MQQQHQSTSTLGKRKDEPRGRRASKFKTYVKAHETVVRNESWYGDEPPVLGKQFTAAKTADRCRIVIEIVLRAAKAEKRVKNKNLADGYKALAKKLKKCRPKARCGSLACPMCARAFQKARVAAQETLISELKTTKAAKELVMATVVPLVMTLKPHELKTLDIRRKNRWLKDILRKAGFDRVMFGSADISWEDGYYQLHWHIAMWTSSPLKLTNRLTKLFPKKEPYDRPALVSTTYDLGFLAYKDKGIKLPDLLRENRRHLPELLSALDRTEPLDLLVLMKLRMSTQKGGLVLRQING